MKKVLLSLAAVSAIATVATPAAAAPAWYGRPHAAAAAQVNVRETQLIRQIERLERRGAISHWEARSLRRELSAIEVREKALRRSGRNGFTAREVAEIHARLDRVEARLQYAGNGPQYGYGYGYGYGNRW